MHVHTCQPLYNFFLDIGDNFSGFSRVFRDWWLSYGATSTSLRHLYKHDILRTCSACNACYCVATPSYLRRCRLEGVCVASRDDKINSTSIRIIIVYIYTRIHALRFRFCPVPGPCAGRKTKKKHLDVCAQGFWARVHQKLCLHPRTIDIRA